MARTSRRFAVKLGRWGRRVKWAQRLITNAPQSVRIAGIVAIVLATFALINLIVQVVRKPSELFFFVGHRLSKQPAETWRQYGPLFRAFATRSISPELLAALAQVESSGNPVDRTYWRWRFSFNPFRHLSAGIQRHRPVPNDRSCLRRGCTSLHPSEISRKFWLWPRPLYPRHTQPCRRVGIDILGPKCSCRPHSVR